MTQNVVTYTVVISVDNSGGRLLPYLTVRLQFEVEARKDVLLVPNAALRWQPRPVRRPRGTRLRCIGVHDGEHPRRARPAGQTPPPRTRPAGVLWISRAISSSRSEVKVGLSDGVVTEISGGGLIEGTEIVIGASRTESDPDALSILPHTWSEPKK